MMHCFDIFRPGKSMLLRLFFHFCVFVYGQMSFEIVDRILCFFAPKLIFGSQSYTMNLKTHFSRKIKGKECAAVSGYENMDL